MNPSTSSPSARIGRSCSNMRRVQAMTAATTPMTGKEFLDSLDDGREVWIYGERVKKITEHPAFRNSARMLARLFDALHDPATKPKLTVKSDAGNDTHAW